MHDASQYRQIRVLITLGQKSHFVDLVAVHKNRGGPERSAVIKRVKLQAEPTDTVHDLVLAAGLALLETADRL
jgi:hypothetical protein